MVYDESDQFRSDQEEKRREKFSRERGPDYAMDRGGPRRPFGGPDRRDYTNGIGRKRPIRDDDFASNMKRSRFDGAIDGYEAQFIRKDGGELAGSGAQTAQLLTFKKFLATQDESLTDEQAIEKYKEYKMEFMKQECERYFQAHKDEEWFRLKYHPEEGKQRGEEKRGNLQKRLEVFNELLANGRLEGLALSFDQAEQLIRIFNEVVIKLEGGTEADIQAANEEELEDESVLDLLAPEELKKREAARKERDAQEKEAMGTGEAKSDEKTNGNATGTDEEMDTASGGGERVEAKPSTKHCPPHKTRSIHFRSIPADVPLADIENLCKQHPGFLRLAITNPAPDARAGKQMRSAWATYRWDVNIKDIFWALRSAKLAGVELGASVNRDLKRRVRTIGATNGLTGHRPIVQNDIRIAAKLVVLLDLKAGLHKEEAEEGEDQGGGGQDEAQLADLGEAVLRGRNPLLANIKDFMVEETNAEEETLQEKAAAIDGSDVTQEYEGDQRMTAFLDRLLLYLRLVHSVDFYAATEYQSEDDMPHRIGIVHVRGRPPSSATPPNWPCTDRGIALLSKRAVEGHIAAFNGRVEGALLNKVVVADAELVKLGKKDAEKAVEEFVNTNTQQLGPEKWLCPLSGKKFKGAEFVHKHLQSKYAKEMENVRYEALYFNNFLADPTRPHNPIFAPKSVIAANHQPADDRREQRTPSPTLLRGRRSSVEENVGGRQVPEATERIPYQRSSWGAGGGGDRFGGSGGNRFGGRPFGAGGGGFGAPPRRPFYEPVNEMNVPAGGGRKDPRAPPSYRDLDAPAEDIF